MKYSQIPTGKLNMTSSVMLHLTRTADLVEEQDSTTSVIYSVIYSEISLEEALAAVQELREPDLRQVPI